MGTLPNDQLRSLFTRVDLILWDLIVVHFQGHIHFYASFIGNSQSEHECSSPLMFFKLSLLSADSNSSAVHSVRMYYI